MLVVSIRCAWLRRGTRGFVIMRMQRWVGNAKNSIFLSWSLLCVCLCVYVCLCVCVFLYTRSVQEWARASTLSTTLVPLLSNGYMVECERRFASMCWDLQCNGLSFSFPTEDRWQKQFLHMMPMAGWSKRRWFTFSILRLVSLVTCSYGFLRMKPA